jgi:hypothetical protein
LAVCGWSATAAAQIRTTPTEADLGEIKRQVSRQIGSRQPDQRAAGWALLAEHPGVEAARLVLERGWKDPDESVRQAAFDALAGFRGERAVGEHLAAALRRSTRGPRPPEPARWMAAVLLASDLEEVQARSAQLVDETLQAAPQAAVSILALAERALEDDDVGRARMLERLALSPAAAAQFALRRGAVRGLCQIRDKEAVAALVRLLPQLHGEVLADAADLLARVSGKALGSEAGAWRRWWQEHQAAFVYPRELPAVSERQLPAPGGSYYGLPVFAQRLLFVIDVSGSMAGPRLQAAQRELAAAIERLDPQVEFGIVAYSSAVHPWQRRLVPATAAFKQQAVRWIEHLVAQSTTATMSALELALTYDVEAIYLLSDGAPTAGRLTEPGAIVAAIEAINRQRLVSIYTVGIGAGAAGDPFDQFLRELAERNLGAYRRVD